MDTMIESLESRRLFAATHPGTFVEGLSEFAVLSTGGAIRTTGSENGAQVARATPSTGNGQPLAILIANDSNITLVVPGAPTP